MKRVLACFVLFGFLIMACQPAIADQTDVVSLGADLARLIRNRCWIFGVSEDDVLILTVTNDEEREYLKGLVRKSR